MKLITGWSKGIILLAQWEPLILNYCWSQDWAIPHNWFLLPTNSFPKSHTISIFFLHPVYNIKTSSVILFHRWRSRSVWSPTHEGTFLFFSLLYLMVGVEASWILVVRLKTSSFETARLKYFLKPWIFNLAVLENRKRLFGVRNFFLANSRKLMTKIIWDACLFYEKPINPTSNAL